MVVRSFFACVDCAWLRWELTRARSSEEVAKSKRSRGKEIDGGRSPAFISAQ